MVWPLALISMVLGVGLPAFASPCVNLLVAQNPLKPSKTEIKVSTEEFISYLSDLLDKQILGDTELLRLLAGLSKGKLVNPIHRQQAELDLQFLIHFEGLQSFIESNALDKDVVQVWAYEHLSEKQVIEKKRAAVKEQTQNTFQQIKFAPVPRGEIVLRDLFKYEKNHEINYSFEMMTAPVTQKQWVDVMGENPAFFAQGLYSIHLDVSGKSVAMQPNNPVERITFWSALEFANRMSDRHGLPRVYDMSEIDFEGRAEEGTLRRIQGDLKLNVVNGDYSQVPGFRLATDIEWRYAACGAGLSSTKYYFGDSAKDMIRHAWYIDNSDGTTHPVADLAPMEIQDHKFYDIYGNVLEWTFARSNARLTYINMAPKDDQRVAHGGSWKNNDLASAREIRCRVGDANQQYNHIGFRLVRTLTEGAAEGAM